MSEPGVLEEHPHQKHAHGLYSTMLGLRFTIRPHHFRDGSMVLRCVATVSTELWRSHTNHEVLHDSEDEAGAGAAAGAGAGVRMLENREAFFERE